MKISIVIPNYNTWDLVNQNISANLFFDDSLIYEIIIVDDCSTSINTYYFPNKVKILKNNFNLHYTKSVNIGMRFAKGDIIILLDSDAYPMNNYISYLITLYESNFNLGCVGFKTVDEFYNDTGNVSNIPTIFSFILGQKLHSLIPKYFKYSIHKPQYPFSCAVSFRRKCLEDVGFLDEKFPVLEADNDLSFRINSSSWDLVYDEKIIIYHKGGNSIPKDYKRVLLHYEYLWKFLIKNNKIKFPFLILFFVKLRLYFEFTLLKIICFFNPTKNNKLKLYGRRCLLTNIKVFKPYNIISYKVS
jgi:GT2 family glycosyltransferase